MNKMGIADHFVTERLPKPLSQFARTYPLVKLEVEVNSVIPFDGIFGCVPAQFGYRQ
jgi:hypothetical protein